MCKLRSDNEPKCCFCPLRIGLIVYYVFLILCTVIAIFDWEAQVLNLALHIPKVITLTVLILCKHDETMAKWNFVTFLVITVLTLPLAILGVTLGWESWNDKFCGEEECSEGMFAIVILLLIWIIVLFTVFEVWMTIKMK